MIPMGMARDSIDDHVALWQRELPDLDPRAEAIVGRMQALLRRLTQQRERALGTCGLQLWEYKTLLDLRRRGSPYRATPTELAVALDVSPPAMTKRVAALERAGYVRRTHDAADRRRVYVTLTQEGLRAWATATGAQGRVETELVGALEPADQEVLADLLRRLVLASGDHGLPQLRRI
jgi:DNA-binding MarR family transcriptional regulator